MPTIPMAKIPYAPPARDNVYEITPEGTYAGILSRVQYFGTHENENDKGQIYDQAKIVLVFEIDYKPDDQDKNRLISTGWPLTYSLSEKATLTKLLKPWLGRSFPDQEDTSGLEWDQMMEQDVMVSIIHKTRKNKDGVEKTYDNIGGLSKLAKGMPALQPVHDQYIWSVLDDLDLKTAEELKMPNFLIEFAKKSKEYQAAKNLREGNAFEEKVVQIFAGKPVNHTVENALVDNDNDAYPF